jgi:phage terminase large subunit
VDEVCDWATSLARDADVFVWDGDGMGTGLRRQVSDAFEGTRTRKHMFKGSLSGKSQDNARRPYRPTEGEKSRSYADTFKNNRAQYYTELARRMQNTYSCVEKGKYFDPNDMISFDSEGIENIESLRSELCRIPEKFNPQGLIQIMSKQDMAKLKIKSPNKADSVMMTMYTPPPPRKRVEVEVIPTANRWN